MNAEYNRRAAIIEGLRAGRSPTDIIKFFGYPRSTVYDIAQKYSALQASGEDPNNPARKICSKKESQGLRRLRKELMSSLETILGHRLEKCRQY